MLKPTQSVHTVEDSPLAIKFTLTIKIYVFVLHGNIVTIRYCQNFEGAGETFSRAPSYTSWWCAEWQLLLNQ